MGTAATPSPPPADVLCCSPTLPPPPTATTAAQASRMSTDANPGTKDVSRQRVSMGLSDRFKESWKPPTPHLVDDISGCSAPVDTERCSGPDDIYRCSAPVVTEKCSGPDDITKCSTIRRRHQEVLAEPSIDPSTSTGRRDRQLQRPDDSRRSSALSQRPRHKASHRSSPQQRGSSRSLSSHHRRSSSRRSSTSRRPQSRSSSRSRSRGHRLRR